jgi:hypothetical protein
MPSDGATGLSFARRVGAEAAEGRLLVHAAPPQLAVTVGVQLDGTAILQTSGVDMAIRCSSPLTPSTTSAAMRARHKGDQPMNRPPGSIRGELQSADICYVA